MRMVVLADAQPFCCCRGCDSSHIENS
jgi:hypothetical protein